MPTISLYSAEGTSGAGKTTSSALPLSLGETVEAVVDAKTGTSRFLLTIKNGSLSANSELPLAKGERLTVRVEQLQPQVVLSIVQRGDQSSSIISGYAAYSSANPEALRDIFALGRELFSEGSLLNALSDSAKKIIGKIANILDSLMLSPAPGKDQFSLKNYLTNLGMFLEFDLRQVLAGKKDLKNLKQDSLKGLLQQLSTELKAQQGKENSPDNLKTLARLLEFSEKAIKTIEGNQIINMQSAAKEGELFFQIPVFLQNDVRTADLFINTEKEKNDASGGKRYQVVMFLSLDALGEMMVDASLNGNKLGCVLKFAEPAVQEFVSGFTQELEKNIREIGFADVFLNCVQSDSIAKAKGECYQELFLDRGAVNVFA
ncbi:MAG: hypothetical protein M0P74_01525 [Syntrophales bacterium]|nr:hypothetical protein [Syntrophales bacterium]